MARYYRRRYRTVVRAPKKKWASNVVPFNASANGTLPSINVQLVKNSAQGSSPTPVIVKCGNFKIQGDVSVQLSGSGSTIVSTVLYVMYIPEGISVANTSTISNLVQSHPEWIIAWKYVGANNVTVPVVDNSETFTFSSRLKRNLNSGDSIYLLGTVNASATVDVNFSGMVQFWTCAN